jgi:hypothetical protein
MDWLPMSRKFRTITENASNSCFSCKDQITFRKSCQLLLIQWNLSCFLVKDIPDLLESTQQFAAHEAADKARIWYCLI